MLDFRHETFLALCKIKNYTKTAEFLNITQPAVTQHIKFLEEYYGIKLFFYKGKKLILTEEGGKLRSFAMTINSDIRHLQESFNMESDKIQPMIFGTTLTIGEYIMPPILAKVMDIYPNLHINMLVNNTQMLMEKLRDGEINFAIVEGFFNKAEYEAKLFSLEEFIPVCSPKSPLAGKKVAFNEILNERLIIREKGSGTREIFEMLLNEHNLSLGSFKRICELGNMNTIKDLVVNNYGITFLYQKAALREIASGQLCKLEIEGFSVQREFNFVFLKNSVHGEEYLRWLSLFKCDNI